MILTGAAWAGKEGALTNAERRMQWVRKAVGLPEDARADRDLVCPVIGKAGSSAVEYGSPSGVFDEIASLTPSYAGMTYERLGVSGL